MDIKKIQHLYWRAGFGLSTKELKALEVKNKQEIVNDLFEASKVYQDLSINTSELNQFNRSKLKNSPSLKKKYNDLNAKKLKELNHAWIKKLVNSNDVLREKMTLFWTNHFVCKDITVKHVEQFNNTLRKHALGSFRDIVKAISKEVTMIKFLNLNQNNKGKPNENFARELLELFTLGIGNYSEKDIKECARGFTGYKNSFEGDFVFNKKQHDFGSKTIFGETGNFDGDEILDIILKQKQCATFICEKVYKYFVNEKINEDHIALMTDIFYKDYNISNLMKYVFSSDWFYNEENIGSKIKSPIELLVGMQKTIPITFYKTEELLKVQDVLDQKLFYPPNVAGWNGGRGWINTNSMLIRVKLPSMILEKESYTIQPKRNFTKTYQFVYVKNKYQDKLDVYIDWKTYKREVKKLDSKDLLSTLILCEPTDGAKNYLKSLGKLTRKKNLVKIMALPEYQMC